MTPQALDPRRLRIFIFDLDGTLIDSKLDLANSVNATREHFGLAPLPHQTIFGYIGDGARMLIQRALEEGKSEDQINRGLSFFLQYYSHHMLDNTVTYPGVREALERLTGEDRALTILTNKPVRFSRAILAGLGISDYFRLIFGGNSFERKKPDPIGVETILRELRADAGQTLMVGDSPIDVLTARNAGAWVCGVTYGLGSHLLDQHPPDLRVDSLTELASLVGR